MRFRHHSNDVAKTLSFSVIHLALAISIGWLLTGTFVLGAMLAFVEPVFNTVISHVIDKTMRDAHTSQRQAVRKSAVVGAAHMVVALLLARLFTGSFASAWLYAVLEPTANAVAHYYFERWWHRASVRAMPAAATT